MSVESFFKLKEFDSLTRMKNNHLKSLKGHEERLEKLTEKLQQGIKNLDTLKQEYLILQQKLFDTEKKLKNAEEQAQRLKDIGGDESKISSYIDEVIKAEESGLDILESIEANQASQGDAKSFLTGLEKTLAEIGDEVKMAKEEEETAIKNLDLRLNLILDELPENFKMILLKTLSKNLAVGSFTRIEAGSCYLCKYKISRTDESEIDMQHRLKVCPQCSRIFLPYGA